MKTNRLIRQIAFLLFAIILFCTSLNKTQGQDVKSILENKQFKVEIESMQIDPAIINPRTYENSDKLPISEKKNRSIRGDQIIFLDPSLNFIQVDSTIFISNLPASISYWAENRYRGSSDILYNIYATVDIIKYEITKIGKRNIKYRVDFELKSAQTSTTKVSIIVTDKTARVDIGGDINLHGKLVSYHE